MQKAVCKNCLFEYEGNFCPQCGQSSHEHRIDAKYILHDVPHSIFHIDQGFFYTLKCMFSHPGRMVRDFLEGKRVKYFRPLSYVVIMSAICTLLIKGIEWLIKKSVGAAVFPAHEENFFKHYFSLFIFIMIPFASFITWLTFYRKKYNYWEHFIANTYIAAQLNIMLVLINFVGLLMILFTKKLEAIDFNILIGVLMSFFLYLYGSVFGYIFVSTLKGRYKSFKISLILTFMNLALFVVYAIGFNITGIMKPW